MAVKPPAITPAVGHGRPRAVIITGTITVGGSGAVSSFACEQCATSTGIVKNAAAGRYDIVFMQKYRNLRVIGCGLNKASGGAFGNTNANTVQHRPATSGYSVTLQALLASSGADTDVASGDIIHFAVEAQR